MAHLLSESNYRKRFRQFDCSIIPTVFQEILKIFRFAQFCIVFFGKYAQFLFRKCFPDYPGNVRMINRVNMPKCCFAEQPPCDPFFKFFISKELRRTYISLCIPNNRTDIVLSKNYIIILDKYPWGVYNINTP